LIYHCAPQGCNCLPHASTIRHREGRHLGAATESGHCARAWRHWHQPCQRHCDRCCPCCLPTDCLPTDACCMTGCSGAVSFGTIAFVVGPGSCAQMFQLMPKFTVSALHCVDSQSLWCSGFRKCHVSQCRVSQCRVSQFRVSQCRVSQCRVSQCRVSQCPVSQCHVSYCHVCLHAACTHVLLKCALMP
jgi:hypothetical protein